MKRRLALVALAAPLLFPTTSWSVDAEPPAKATSDAASDQEAYQAQKQAWESRFHTARDRVGEARQRHQAATDSYKQMRHRRRERGDEKKTVLQELAASELALGDAETALKELFHEARRAGVPPGWMRMPRAQASAVSAALAAPEPSASEDDEQP